LSSFTLRVHSWKDFDTAFTKLRFVQLRETNEAIYYQNPDGAIEIIQKSEHLDQPYIEEKLKEIGMSYRVFVWLSTKT
jgi:hypothetical protein